MTTLPDFLRTQEELVQEAALALPHQFTDCTYSRGHIRQAIYLCLTCKDVRGICSSCSISCHTNHEQLELFPKRNFRCDCPTVSMSHKCTLHPKKEAENTGNAYGQNFGGTFCRCGQPYDAKTERETMIQCLACEDWFHESCCNLRERPPPRGQTPELDSTLDHTDEGDDAASDISSASLPPALITSADFDSFMCGACVQKIPILQRFAGTPGCFMVTRVSATDPWRVVGENHGPGDMDEPAEIISSETPTKSEESGTPGDATIGSKRRLSTPPDGIPEGKRVKATLASVNCLAPPPNSIAESIYASIATDSTLTIGTGDLFLAEGFRQRWCHCHNCSLCLKAHPYLLEEEETYEPPEDPDSGLSLEELGLRALEFIPRERAINGIHAFNKLRDELVSYLRPFAQEGKVVGESDVKGFFDDLRAQAEDKNRQS